MNAPATHKRVAVIGAGFGGLAAAVRLQAAGLSVVLFEALDKPGGRAYTFKQDGFTFDAGPTVLTVPESLEEIFACAQRQMKDYVELLPVRPFYRLLWHDGDRFDYEGDTDLILEQIRKRSPEDVAGYQRFYEFSKSNFQAGYQGLADAAFLKLWDMIRVAPTMAKLRSDRSVYETVSGFIKDEHLRQALSFHTLLIGGNPFETSSIYTMIHYLERQWGVHFARGGTGALVAALAKLFVEIGGELRLDCPVERILFDSGSGPARIRSKKNADEPFDLVVSNADLHHTYAKLLRDEPRARPMLRRLEKMQWSMSLFVLYFGTDRLYSDLAHHSIIFGPRYEPLLKEIFHGSGLPEDFSLYLHAPCVTDPTLAPEGCGAYYVLSPVPHLGRGSIDWQAEAEGYADRILASLETFMPEVRKHVVTRRMLTPLDFQSRLGAYQGAAFSVAPLLSQSAWFRPHNRDPRLPQLYIVGAGTHPGAGVPGVINSAKATARLVLQDLGMAHS